MNNFIIVITVFVVYAIIAAIISALLKKFIGEKLEDTGCTRVGYMFPILLPLLLFMLAVEFIEEKISKNWRN